ncbi:MAG TPA: NifU family protein [Terracidiphilus sp.]|nr:NifU family protein [Terracidiphilus sp.]
MANDSEFQEQVRQLGQRIEQFEQMPAGPAKTAGRELVQLLMDVHGEGLERMMEIVFESGDQGAKIIDRLGKDASVASLLLLYSLHPDDLETRVEKAAERMRPRLRKLACAIESLEVRESAVQVRLGAAGHSCGSSSKDIRSIVEDCIYQFAPDVTSLEILGLEEPATGGFVALDSLLRNGFASVASTEHARESQGLD